MILLGAGASKVFGLKTMQDLTKDLVKKMRDKGHDKTIDDILRALEKFGLTPDFENIYTTLEALVNPREGIKKSGAFTAYVASQGGFKSIEGHPEYKDVLSDFRDLIYDECSISRGVIESKRGVFDKLFEAAERRSEPRVLTTKMGTVGTLTVDVGKTIVTTNYDMAVELYLRWTSTELADGFKATPKEYTKELDFEEYYRLDTSNWLIKLHGSIWQFKQRDKIIQTIGPLDSLQLQISVGEQMMIYPVGEKPILQEPYFSFYSIFKEQPWETLIAIGYSFRDAPINTVILERLTQALRTRMPQTKLIVVNPHAENVIKNLGPTVSKLDQRMIRIDECFRDDEKLFKKIGVAIQSPNLKAYKRHIGSG